MMKPDDIPADIWSIALKCSCVLSAQFDRHVESIARSIMDESERCALIAERHGEIVSNEPTGKACSRNIAAAIRTRLTPPPIPEGNGRMSEQMNALLDQHGLRCISAMFYGTHVSVYLHRDAASGEDECVGMSGANFDEAFSKSLQEFARYGLKPASQGVDHD